MGGQSQAGQIPVSAPAAGGRFPTAAPGPSRRRAVPDPCRRRRTLHGCRGGRPGCGCGRWGPAGRSRAARRHDQRPIPDVYRPLGTTPAP